MQHIQSKKLSKVLLALYLILLTWVILFKLETNLEILFSMNLRNINLIPFAESTIINGRVDLTEILLNILAFIPFGVYMAMINKEKSLFNKVLPIFGVSLAYEVLQYLLAIGATDITDLMGNTLGGVLGIGCYMLLAKFFKDKTDLLVNSLALIGSLLGVSFLGILIVVNL